MVVMRQTQECFPKPVMFGPLELAPAPEANHEKCAKGYTIPGLIGGWMCPCECHRTTNNTKVVYDVDLRLWIKEELQKQYDAYLAAQPWWCRLCGECGNKGEEIPAIACAFPPDDHVCKPSTTKQWGIDEITNHESCIFKNVTDSLEELQEWQLLYVEALGLDRKAFEKLFKALLDKEIERTEKEDS